MPAAASGLVAAVAELIGMLPGAGLDRPAPSKCWLRPRWQVGPPSPPPPLGDTFPASFPIELVTMDLEYASADAALRHTTVALPALAQRYGSPSHASRVDRSVKF